MSDKYTSGEYQRKVGEMVGREVGHCVSMLVSDLAKGYGETQGDIGELCEEAFELCTPTQDWESAADEAGWTTYDDGFRHEDGEIDMDADDWEELCREHDIEPHESEIYEHWIVSGWLAEKLAERGERVGELAGLKIWGRGCTGQAIKLDRVICDIYDAGPGRYEAA